MIDDQLAEDDRVVTRWRAVVPPPPAAVALPAPVPLPAPPAEVTPLPVPAGARAWTSAYRGISIIRVLAGKQVDSHTECIAPRPGWQRAGA